MRVKNFLSQFQNIFFLWVLERVFSDCKSVLDVGCGHSSSVGLIKRKFTSEGIDIYRKNINESRRKHLHDKYKVGDVTKLSKLYKKKSFDACVAIDVIEHFSKKDALRLLKDMEFISRKKVVILTPNGFYEQHAFDGNPHQVHKSGWTKRDLEKLGYKVYGLRGLKFLRDEHAGIKYKPWIFWGALSFISEIIFFLFPSLSFDLYAVKIMPKVV